VAAVIQVESMWNADAVSPKGAMGLMQLMPATAKGHGVTDPFDPAQNVEAGIAELGVQLRRHENEISMALAAYNAGGVAVRRYRGIPPYRETLDYVQKVLDLYFSWTEQDLRGEAVDAGPPSGRGAR
jgi:soluble lytic murein transglycosylase-like protein